MVRKNKQTKKCRECGKNKSINKFKKNQRTKDKRVFVCNDCISEKSAKTRKTKIYTDFYIYRFLDKDNNIIYVGKTTNIDSRVCGHIGIANSLSQTENQFLMYQNIYRIEYSKVESDYHMNLYEIHYICKYNPPFNDEYSIKECLSYDDFDKIDELDYCKNDCLIENDEECDSCKDRITWREYYNNRIKESKLKFHNKE